MPHVVLLFPEPGPRDTEFQILPLGVLYVAAALQASGHEVTAIDQRKDPAWRATLRAAIARPGTVCVGISSMTGPQIAYGLQMAAAVREAAPELPLVWGGVHPSLLPEQTAQHPLVDIVCFGEGETAFPPLVDALAAGRDWRSLPGLCFEEDGRVRKNPPAPLPDLDSLPPLPYEVFDLERYKVSPLRSGPSLPMVTSRGCSFRCAYCYVQEFFDRKWRALSAENVLAEVTRLQNDYGAEGIFLLDDYFFQNRRRAAEILQGLIDGGFGINLYNANCRADFLYRSSDEYLELMRDAGIKTLYVGTESGSPRTLREMLKDITVDQVLEVNRRLAKVGIRAVYSFMAGMPGETEADVKETLALMVRLKEENPQALLYSVALFVPFPGTPYFHKAREMGCRFPESLEGWARYDYAHVNLDYISPRFRRFLERVKQASAFIDVDGKAGRLVTPFARAYSRVVRRRLRSKRYGPMPELVLLRVARAAAARLGS